MSDTISVLHPGVEGVVASSVNKPQRQAVKGPMDMRGLRLALLDNTKVNADRLLEAVAKRLQAYGLTSVQTYRKRHAGESGADVIAEMMKWKPDLVLTGLGD
jgi:nucleotide-binding universal stress UspA family protein